MSSGETCSVSDSVGQYEGSEDDEYCTTIPDQEQAESDSDYD